MCKRLVIDLVWDDDHPEDAKLVFVGDPKRGILDQDFETGLLNFLQDAFVGMVSLEVMDIP